MNSPIREEDLHAFVDGRLEPARRAEVERLIAAEPALRLRLEAWARQRQALREAASALPPGPTPPSLSTTMLLEQHLARRRQPWRMAAAAAVIFALGAMSGMGGSMMMPSPPRPTEIARLQMEAASAYRVFAVDARPMEMDASHPEALRAWLAQKLGHAVTLPDLSAQGYHLLGGRVLAAMYGPAGMLIYEDAMGTRLTVYIQPMRLGREAEMRRVAMGSVSGFAWITGKIGYSVLAGEDDGEELDGIAAKLHAASRT
ncbi:anti-sigma factor [Acetobacteraceae bacterium H6797]|nr:anti-sigma factor [Acetobacteraceae bacterium H6797]